MHLQLDPVLVRQLGVITRRQCFDEGLSFSQVDRLVARGLLVPVHRGVFRDPSHPVCLDQRALAAVMAAGPGAAASHRLAVALWGVPNYQCLMKEVTAPGLRRIPGVFAHRSNHRLEITDARGIPITSRARTILDVSTVVSSAILRRWLESWLSTRVVSIEQLTAELDRMKGHAGVPLVRGCLDAATILHAETDSVTEAALGLLLQRHGLPPLVLHHVVDLPSGTQYELDWSYPALMTAFEVDGYGVHLRSLQAFEHDRFRRNELEIAGWTILNFTKRQIEKRPKTVVQQVERMIATATTRDPPRQAG